MINRRHAVWRSDHRALLFVRIIKSHKSFQGTTLLYIGIPLLPWLHRKGREVS